jgi:hypothetical protein
MMIVIHPETITGPCCIRVRLHMLDRLALLFCINANPTSVSMVLNYLTRCYKQQKQQLMQWCRRVHDIASNSALSSWQIP